MNNQSMLHTRGRKIPQARRHQGGTINSTYRVSFDDMRRMVIGDEIGMNMMQRAGRIFRNEPRVAGIEERVINAIDNGARGSIEIEFTVTDEMSPMLERLMMQGAVRGTRRSLDEPPTVEVTLPTGAAGSLRCFMQELHNHGGQVTRLTNNHPPRPFYEAEVARRNFNWR